MEPIVDSILNNQALLKNDTIIIGDFDTGAIKSNIKKPIYGFSTDRGKNWTNVWLSQNEIEWSHRNIKKISTGNMVNQCLIIFMSVLR